MLAELAPWTTSDIKTLHGSFFNVQSVITVFLLVESFILTWYVGEIHDTSIIHVLKLSFISLT